MTRRRKPTQQAKYINTTQDSLEFKTLTTLESILAAIEALLSFNKNKKNDNFQGKSKLSENIRKAASYLLLIFAETIKSHPDFCQAFPEITIWIRNSLAHNKHSTHVLIDNDVEGFQNFLFDCLENYRQKIIILKKDGFVPVSIISTSYHRHHENNPRSILFLITQAGESLIINIQQLSQCSLSTKIIYQLAILFDALWLGEILQGQDIQGNCNPNQIQEWFQIICEDQKNYAHFLETIKELTRDRHKFAHAQCDILQEDNSLESLLKIKLRKDIINSLMSLEKKVDDIRSIIRLVNRFFSSEETMIDTKAQITASSPRKIKKAELYQYQRSIRELHVELQEMNMKGHFNVTLKSLKEFNIKLKKLTKIESFAKQKIKIDSLVLEFDAFLYILFTRLSENITPEMKTERLTLVKWIYDRISDNFFPSEEEKFISINLLNNLDQKFTRSLTIYLMYCDVFINFLGSSIKRNSIYLVNLFRYIFNKKYGFEKNQVISLINKSIKEGNYDFYLFDTPVQEYFINNLIYHREFLASFREMIDNNKLDINLQFHFKKASYTLLHLIILWGHDIYLDLLLDYPKLAINDPYTFHFRFNDFTTYGLHFLVQMQFNPAFAGDIYSTVFDVKHFFGRRLCASNLKILRKFFRFPGLNPNLQDSMGNTFIHLIAIQDTNDVIIEGKNVYKFQIKKLLTFLEEQPEVALDKFNNIGRALSIHNAIGYMNYEIVLILLRHLLLFQFNKLEIILEHKTSLFHSKIIGCVLKTNIDELLMVGNSNYRKFMDFLTSDEKETLNEPENYYITLIRNRILTDEVRIKDLKRKNKKMVTITVEEYIERLHSYYEKSLIELLTDNIFSGKNSEFLVSLFNRLKNFLEHDKEHFAGMHQNVIAGKNFLQQSINRNLTHDDTKEEVKKLVQNNKNKIAEHKRNLLNMIDKIFLLPEKNKRFFLMDMPFFFSIVTSCLMIDWQALPYIDFKKIGPVILFSSLEKLPTEFSIDCTTQTSSEINDYLSSALKNIHHLVTIDRIKLINPFLSAGIIDILNRAYYTSLVVHLEFNSYFYFNSTGTLQLLQIDKFTVACNIQLSFKFNNLNDYFMKLIEEFTKPGVTVQSIAVNINEMCYNNFIQLLNYSVHQAQTLQELQITIFNLQEFDSEKKVIDLLNILFQFRKLQRAKFYFCLPKKHFRFINMFYEKLGKENSFDKLNTYVVDVAGEYKLVNLQINLLKNLKITNIEIVNSRDNLEVSKINIPKFMCSLFSIFRTIQSIILCFPYFLREDDYISFFRVLFYNHTLLMLPGFGLENYNGDFLFQKYINALLLYNNYYSKNPKLPLTVKSMATDDENLSLSIRSKNYVVTEGIFYQKINKKYDINHLRVAFSFRKYRANYIVDQLNLEFLDKYYRLLFQLCTLVSITEHFTHLFTQSVLFANQACYFFGIYNDPSFYYQLLRASGIFSLKLLVRSGYLKLSIKQLSKILCKEILSEKDLYFASRLINGMYLHPFQRELFVSEFSHPCLNLKNSYQKFFEKFNVVEKITLTQLEDVLRIVYLKFFSFVDHPIFFNVLNLNVLAVVLCIVCNFSLDKNEDLQTFLKQKLLENYDSFLKYYFEPLYDEVVQNKELLSSFNVSTIFNLPNTPVQEPAVLNLVDLQMKS